MRPNRKELISANSRHVNEREQIIQRIIFLPPTAFKTFHRNDTTSFEYREFRRLSDAMFQTKNKPACDCVYSGVRHRARAAGARQPGALDRIQVQPPSEEIRLPVPVSPCHRSPGTSRALKAASHWAGPGKRGRIHTEG